ncbi:hypothetical protein HDV04_004122 [Boothiomyces sp. JEL0838]|nr:hypothetical protein HDV04_004122 [Boothiomyces sp. JEL0838]
MTRLITAAFTSGSLYVVGDLINQTVFTPHKHIDWQQSAKFALIGFTLHGPYFWAGFKFLDRMFGMAKAMPTVLKKAVAGQLLVFPPFSLMFLSYSAILDGKKPIENIQSQFVPIFINGCGVWPIANVVNFRFVPIQHRMIYINLVGIGWNTYLSYAVHHSIPKDD